jgi:hypothetical protein
VGGLRSRYETDLRCAGAVEPERIGEQVGNEGGVVAVEYDAEIARHEEKPESVEAGIAMPLRIGIVRGKVD